MRGWMGFSLYGVLLVAAGVCGCPEGLPPVFVDPDALQKVDVELVTDLQPEDIQPDTFELAEDLPAPVCDFEVASTLPGVSFDLSGNDCVFTLSKLAAGVTFHYKVDVDKDLDLVLTSPLDAGWCDEPGPSGLRTLEKIHGNDQAYCVCDVGYCGKEPGFEKLAAGKTEHSFDWDGKNWNGPTETGTPKGDPFPPGDYVAVVRAEGQYKKSGVTKSFAVNGTLPITVKP